MSMEFVEKKAKALYESSSGLSKPSDQFGYGHPFLSYSDVFHNYYVPTELTTQVNSNEKDRESCSIKRGDVFLTRTSETTDELGMSCVALKDYPNATFNGFTKRLRPITDEIVPEYAAYFFRSSYFRAQCMAMASLITRASLNDGMIERFRIRYPKSKDAQIAIGKVLMNYDNLIEVNTERIKVLEQMAENLYKEWFVRFRFPGHEKAEFEDGIPRGWTIRKIGEISTIKAGGDKPEVFSDYPCSGIDVPIYSNGIDNDGLYGFTDKPNIIGESVTISARGTVGCVCLRRVPYVPIIRLIAIVPNTSIVTASYLNHYLRRDSVIANGTSQQQITVPMVFRKRIIVPRRELLLQFGALEQPILAEMDLLKAQNRCFISQRDLLLPRLMSGKLEVS